VSAVLREKPARRERILVIDDDPGLAEVIVMLLSGEGYRVEHAATVRAGLAQIAATEFDLVITDLKLPDGTGVDAIGPIKEIRRDLPIILMTSYSSMESAIGALRSGAVDYIIKPFDNENFLHAAERALNERRMLRENAILKRSLNKVKADLEIIGESEGIRHVTGMMRRVAASEANVLIRGESGTGKELVAVGIHLASPRGDGPFVPINCGAIPADLLESELFGHAKGAFTGATQTTEGLIREAHGGTLFLDEFTELAPGLQVKLLRVLQDREVRPVGGKHVYKVDVRFIAATNKEDLRKAITGGQLREDLFYRLNVIDIHVPPLRERGGDVRLLAQHFIDRHSRRMGKRIHAMSPDLGDFLARYPWPGNVRELDNLIERAVILAEGDVLTSRDLAEVMPGAAKRPGSAPPASHSEGAPVSVEDYIRDTVVRYQDRYTEIELARLLGIGRKALWVRRRKWGLKRSGARKD
jgi:DNA-binding NtrC family response regulator